jgi:hypothetical protein
MSSTLLQPVGFETDPIGSRRISLQHRKKRMFDIIYFKGLQNTGVSIFFLSLSLPQHDSDLAIVLPIFVCIINS